MMSKHLTRESWLMAGLEELKPQFGKPYKVPTKIRVSCGFPSHNPLGMKKRSVGECWSDDASKGKVFEIFISPVLSNPIQVLDTLIHEIVHAVVGLKAKHGKLFKECALSVGLTGKMTSTVAGPDLKKELQRIAKVLGPYPHDELSHMTNAKPKEGCRQLKASCPDCGYTIRVTRKWLDVGLPTCCCGSDFQEGDSDESE